MARKPHQEIFYIIKREAIDELGSRKKGNGVSTETIPRPLLNSEAKLREHIQFRLTEEERQRLDWMAETEGWSPSEMARLLCLQSLEIWEKSAPGRRRR